MSEVGRRRLIRLLRKVEMGQRVSVTRRQSEAWGVAHEPMEPDKSWSWAARRKPHAKLGIVPEPRTSTRMRYEYDPLRVEACGGWKAYCIPGYDSRLRVRWVLRPVDMGPALGLGLNTLETWVRRGDFPAPIGHYMRGRVRYPAYTMQEALTYLHVLAAETGGEWVNRPFVQCPTLRETLASAREAVRAELTRKGDRAKWMLRHERTPTAGTPA